MNTDFFMNYCPNRENFYISIMNPARFISDYILSFFRIIPEVLKGIDNTDALLDIQPLPDNFIWSRTLGRYSRRDLHRRTGLGKLIYLAKYKSNREAADRLAEIIIGNLKSDPPPFRPDIITIVPDTISNRSFSPVPYIAQKMADFWEVDLILDFIGPAKLNKPQKRRTPEKRRSDIESRYVLRYKQELVDRKIFLFDDIYGTGQSLCEAADLLVEAGAKAVLAMTIVRISDW